MFFSTAYSSAAQFLNDGSTTLTRASFAGVSADTQCQRGPPHASTRPNAWPPTLTGGSGARADERLDGRRQWGERGALDRARHAARHDRAAEQPVTGDPLVQPEQFLADPETVGVAEGKARVVDDHADVGDVVVEALELEEDDAQPSGARRHVAAGECLERLAVG